MSHHPPTAPQAAVLVVNLGTPTAPTARAVRRYLAEFLSDRRVIETPRWIWWPILYGVILRIRPRRSARAYATVWTEGGSPLLVHSRALSEKLGNALGPTAEVALAMRYGEPAIGAAIEELQRLGVRRILVLPLYPQYAAATTASVFDAVAAALRCQRWLPELRFIGDYHAEPLYIEALARSVEAHWQQHGRAQRLLLSFHGLPQRCVTQGDPYFDQCQATATLLRARLGLSGDDLFVSFQSRVGAEKWIAPYTEEVLARWPGEGVRRIQVLCPGFAVDCLETLEEIAIRDRELFLEAGGESLAYIAALNDADAHVELLATLVRRNLQGWPVEALVDA